MLKSLMLAVACGLAPLRRGGAEVARSVTHSVTRRSRASAFSKHCQWLSATGAVIGFVARAARAQHSQHFSQAPA